MILMSVKPDTFNFRMTDAVRHPTSADASLPMARKTSEFKHLPCQKGECLEPPRNNPNLAFFIYALPWLQAI
jgi:hypothetical protein